MEMVTAMAKSSGTHAERGGRARHRGELHLSVIPVIQILFHPVHLVRHVNAEMVFKSLEKSVMTET